MWLNFHTHSNYCDGKSTLEETLAYAKSLGLGWLGFSSHAPLPFDSVWCMKKENLSAYVDHVTRLKNSTHDLELYCGLEVDYIPGRIGPNDFPELDYTIGSVHFVGNFADGRGWEIDGPHNFFLEGLDRIFNNDVKAVVCRYNELTRDMLERSAPDVVGHIDKIKMQNTDGKFFSEDEAWYREQVLATIEAVARSGRIVEVNTRGIYQKKTATTYPSPWVLEVVHQKNIPITISSDAHHCDDLINQFPATASLLRQIGFREIHSLSEGKWKAFKFNENGIY